jgi:hypothetical protein
MQTKQIKDQVEVPNFELPPHMRTAIHNYFTFFAEAIGISILIPPFMGVAAFIYLKIIPQGSIFEDNLIYFFLTYGVGLFIAAWLGVSFGRGMMKAIYKKLSDYINWLGERE